MPYVVTLLPQSRTGLVVGSGRLTGHDLVRACTDMVSDEDWEAGFDEVWDLSAAREVDITPDELDGLVESAHAYAARIGANRVVFVTMSDGVAMVIRLFERLTADLPRTYHTARTREEAADWLGISVPQDEDEGLEPPVTPSTAWRRR